MADGCPDEVGLSAKGVLFMLANGELGCCLDGAKWVGMAVLGAALADCGLARALMLAGEPENTQ